MYRGNSVVTAESVHLGAAAYARAEILRQRVLHGNLSVPLSGDSEDCI